MNNIALQNMSFNKFADNLDTKGIRVLVVEDEEDIQNIISFNLEAEGFIVTKSDNGLDAWNKIQKHLPDIILLDIMIPGINGIDLCKKIKSHYDVPIIMVTAKAGELDAVLGLEMGADDYIRKPFSQRELIARLRAVLRRKEKSDNLEGSITIGGIHMNKTAHKVTVNGKNVDLTLIEYKLLKLFMENPDIAFTRDRLLDRVWGRDVYVSDRTVDVNIKRLREKLGEEKYRLETIRGIGYRFKGDNDK
ncbi:MAG: DNA-binding response regulator [Candidatus Sericytochromatia bacterium]|nr:MAG: DNA-binding response regulator [Candidatus Sericytochromatia bacterium]GIX40716.1 MAG: DNA-binding response regulator [Leptospiraceae bacterium]